MDRMIYVAMSGAKQVLSQQAVAAHNLANATTAGYRAETGVFRAIQVSGEGLPTRAFVAASTPASDFTPASIVQTGRDLDVAVQGQGWIAVQLTGGSEAYTRNGSLQVGPNGQLQTASGHTVQGDGGPIAIPPDTVITIAKDGTVSAVATGSSSSAVTALGRIKLVNPPESDLQRNANGLFRLKGGGTAEADAKVVLAPGAIEGSNVNVVEAMVDMIALSRQFEMQMKLLQDAENNSQHASRMLELEG